MASTKSPARRDSKQLRAVPNRTSSYTRFKSPIQRLDEGPAGGSAPITLPPPPFEHETLVQGLEWWLDAHMGLASGLAWLDQLLDGGATGAFAATVRGLAAQAEGVRDALYELYCDAADERLRDWIAPGAPFEAQVRGSYAWCASVVTLLGAITNGLRSEGGPDWSAAKALFRDVERKYARPSQTLKEALNALQLDTNNPTEPLRNLPQDLGRLFMESMALEGALASRFA
jgi:hypothetical protein